ncbi:uncharacterized protein LOC108486210 isoform X1 [Gossypium arboreum]|uniref:Uncharacterized protein n=1 Tax=Gossypium arboreum TaxID=29729 RepID=A0ABR0PXY1_GOSAR|nr:uncharacterized protein LOC108486210 isoform X1 [Gossypium arboreum]KAK5831647.1 hypothetical protein PVK06_015445 [Gossypium arboreum]
MPTKARSQVSSERQKWDQIFEGVVGMLKTQQQQLETLTKEKKILGDRINTQYERWASDVRLYEDHISQMRTDLESKEMTRLLEAAKADMIVGLKQREAFLCKLKLEETSDELTDFRIWFDILCKNSNDVSLRDPKGTKKGMLGDEDIGSKSVNLKTLEGNLRRLKLKYENLASEKSCQIAALMAENKFAWNQFNIMETQFTDKLNSKNFELDKANRKIEALISSMEELRSSNAEKDEMIQILKSELSQKEADASRFHEVSKMSRQVEFLRKPRSSSHTPVIKHCTAREGTSVLGDENGGRSKCSITMKKGSSAPHVHDSLKDNGRGSRSSKRKKDDEIRISETPNLFTSTFKVPRLRDSSPKSR